MLRRSLFLAALVALALGVAAPSIAVETSRIVHIDFSGGPVSVTGCKDGTVYAVTGAADTADCTTGLGSTFNLCQCSAGVLVNEDTAGAGDITDVFGCATGDCSSIALGATDLLDASGVDASTGTEGIILPQHATACAGGTAEGQLCWEADANTLWIGDAATLQAFVAAGNISGDGTLTTAGVLEVTEADALEANPADCGANTWATTIAANGDLSCSAISGGAGISDGTVVAGDLDTLVRTWYAPLWVVSPDNVECRPPTETTIGSWGAQPTINCDADDASTIEVTTRLPDGYDPTATVSLRACYIQDAADTGTLLADAACRCVGATETPSAYPSETAMDDAGVTGADAWDCVTSAGMTPAGTCAAGDKLQCRYQIDSTSGTAMATLYYTDFDIEYTWDPAD